MDGEQRLEGKEDAYHFFEKQEVSIENIDSTGWILDVGGGGEGIIGKLEGKQVVAIDANQRELEESAQGPLKIVMDAREQNFLDGSFDTVTSFFTLMYISEVDHEKVFSEVYRVLSPGGSFLIWDVIFPPRDDSEKDGAIFLLKVNLPDEEIETGYGVPWPIKGREINHYLHIARAVGFEVLDSKQGGRTFFLEMQKN